MNAYSNNGDEHNKYENPHSKITGTVSGDTQKPHT